MIFLSLHDLTCKADFCCCCCCCWGDQSAWSLREVRAAKFWGHLLCWVIIHFVFGEVGGNVRLLDRAVPSVHCLTGSGDVAFCFRWGAAAKLVTVTQSYDTGIDFCFRGHQDDHTRQRSVSVHAYTRRRLAGAVRDTGRHGRRCRGARGGVPVEYPAVVTEHTSLSSYRCNGNEVWVRGDKSRPLDRLFSVGGRKEGRMWIPAKSSSIISEVGGWEGPPRAIQSNGGWKYSKSSEVCTRSDPQVAGVVHISSSAETVGASFTVYQVPGTYE